MWSISSVVIEPRLTQYLCSKIFSEMITKRTIRLILFAHLIGAAQVNSQTLTDYLLRPASTIFNTLTGGLTSEQGQNANRNERPAQSQSFPTANQQSQRFQSTNRQFSNLNSYQTAQSCANSLSYQRDYSGNSVGIVTINNPNRSRNMIKVTLTVAAQLSSVSFTFDVWLDSSISADSTF